jgi:hypothetical protein
MYTGTNEDFAVEKLTLELCCECIKAMELLHKHY